MNRNNELVEIAVDVIKETEKALLIFDGSFQTWIPKSKIKDQCENKGNITSIFLQEWYALQEGLI